MKNVFFALIALSLMFQVACKNTPSTPNAAPEVSTADADALNKQIQEDFYAGRAITYPLTATFKGYMDLGLAMKNASQGVQGENQTRVRELFMQTLKFTQPYVDHMAQTTKLDSLSIHLAEGKITPEAAKKEYAEIKTAMLAAAEKLPSAAEGAQSLSALKAEFESVFSGANKKASGGN
jgi:hypothetical protein